MIIATEGFELGMRQTVGRLIRLRQQTHPLGFPCMSLGSHRLPSVKCQAQQLIFY
jgi:hypothetical protein